MYCIKDKIKNINIVIGCSIGCKYCYARVNNKRFHQTPDFEVPVYFPNKLSIMSSCKSRAYFMTGQSDLSGWRDEWINDVFSVMKENPDKTYIFLTKRPDLLKLNDVPSNGWFGVTVTSAKEKYKIDELRKNVKSSNLHVTFEPIFDDIGELSLEGIKWVVIGTETGSRRNKAVTKREWVDNSYDAAKRYGTLVFFKEDLQGIIDESMFVQEMPEEFL